MYCGAQVIPDITDVSCECGSDCWGLINNRSASVTTLVGVTKVPLVMFSVLWNFDLSELWVRYSESHSYLTGVSAAYLQWHLSNENVIYRYQCFDNFEKIDKYNVSYVKDDQITSQFCTFSDKNLWADWIIIFKITTPRVFARFESWAHKPLVKWFLCEIRVIFTGHLVKAVVSLSDVTCKFIAKFEFLAIF